LFVALQELAANSSVKQRAYTDTVRIVVENVAHAFQSLASSWLRTSLTTLGMIIGVGSVALLVSIGLGVQKDVTEQIQSLGANLIFVVPGKLDKNSTPNTLALLGVSTLTEYDVRHLRALKSVDRVAPFIFVGGTVDQGAKPHSAFVIATTSDWFEMRPRPLAEGRVFTAAEQEQHVCVLAQKQREEIFGDGQAVGGFIVVQGIPFEVIGVLKEESASPLFGDGGFENMIFLPAAAVEASIPKTQINRILIQTHPEVSPDDALDQIATTLKNTHNGHEDFGVLTQRQLLGTIYRLMSIVTSLVAGISAISLVVAGIGIMNIMLVTVTERTHEIGIRKAVGARKRDIFLHFLVEAIVISFLGGVTGLAVAIGVGKIVQSYSPLKPLLEMSVVMLSLGICVAVGLIFGTAPALRAARLSPIESLRRE
jgi:putative ABC transport system permease protein